MAKNFTALKHGIHIVISIYLGAPAIAAMFRYPDPRGPRVYPRIYPRIYHEALFSTAYEFWHKEKPPVPYDRDRAWFYGMERPVNEQAAIAHAAAKWFPGIKNPPPIVPILPEGFAAGYATNPLIWKGKPTLLWAPPADIERLHRETTVRQIFVVSDRTDDFNKLGYYAGDEAVKMAKEQGVTKIESGMAVIDGWTMEWFSGLSLSEHYSWTAYAVFSDPHKSGREVGVSFLAPGEDGLPIWRAFVDSCRKRARDLTPAEREEIRQAHDPANFPAVDPLAEDQDPFAEPSKK